MTTTRLDGFGRPMTQNQIARQDLLDECRTLLVARDAARGEEWMRLQKKLLKIDRQLSKIPQH